METDIKTIRKAVLANRGGLEEASDEQIMIIWQSLPADIQKQYLDSVGSATDKHGKNKEI